MTKVTIITAFYNGEKYLENLLDMVEKNVKYILKTKLDIQVEYIIVNDSPWEIIEHKIVDKSYRVKILNNPKNVGIHETRARGICEAEGEYILILDQDDEISENYIVSQYLAINGGQIVVSNGYKENEEGKTVTIYRSGRKMKLVNSKLVYLKAANQIVSPGQCLIKKEIIPEVWLKTTQKINGSDDLFLWLLIMNSGIKFVLNEEKLYVHKQVGYNISNDLKKMCESDLEMCLLAEEKNLLSPLDIKRKRRMCAFLQNNGYTHSFRLWNFLRYIDIVLIKIYAKFI